MLLLYSGGTVPQICTVYHLTQRKEDTMKKFLVSRLSKLARYVNPPHTRYPHRDYPSLESKHLDNARLFAHRKDLISSLELGEGGVIAEVGVAHGDFSEFLLDELRPHEFVAFDLFEIHDWDPKQHHWSIGRLNNMTHLEFYRQRFCHRGTQVKTEVGQSDSRLATYKDRYFDLIYIDADHRYDAVKRDLRVASSKLKDNGIIVLNDYTMFDIWEWNPYGVVQSVNEFIVTNNNWKVCAFALEREMYGDIAIRRSSAC
jgi:Methyltransferase domain